MKKERVTIALRRKPTFEELVQENRRQILKDSDLLNEIDDKIDQKYHKKDA